MEKMPMALCKLEEMVGVGNVAYIREENDCYYFRVSRGVKIMVTKEGGEIFFEEGESVDKRWEFKGSFRWDGTWDE